MNKRAAKGEHRMEEQVDLKKVEQLYNDMPEMWPEWDRWYTYTHQYMCDYLGREIPRLKLQDTTKILNAGSNGNTYGIRGEHYHIDICLKNIAHLEHAVQGSIEEMPYEEAAASGAAGVFERKYGETVKVYTIGDYSCEICGGPHAANTSELGQFKIQKEESSAAGIRRIKAVIG